MTMANNFSNDKIMNNFLNINIVNRNEVKEITPFYFVDNNFVRYQQVKQFSRHSQGIPLRIVDSDHARVSIGLKRHGSSAIAMIMFLWKKLQPIKTVLVPSINSDSGDKILFRLCGKKDSHILIYQECNALIEIRRLLSFKKEKVFDLQSICRDVGIELEFKVIKVCMDAIYVTELGVVVLCLNQMIVSFRDEVNYSVLHQFVGLRTRDRFISLQYSYQYKTLLAETITSIMLFEFNANGLITTSRVFQHPLLKSINARVVEWDPSESLIISAQDSKVNKEDLYVFQYSGSSDIKLLVSTKGKKLHSAYYSPKMKRLLYIDDDDLIGSKEVRSISLSQILEEHEQSGDQIVDDEDKLIEGKFVARLPDLVERAPRFAPRFVGTTLFIRFMQL